MLKEGKVASEAISGNMERALCCALTPEHFWHFQSAFQGNSTQEQIFAIQILKDWLKKYLESCSQAWWG